MGQPTGTIAELTALLDAGRFAELERQLATAEADPACARVDLARLRGRLALEGKGPVADLALAGDALARAGAPDAAAVTAHAARLLHRAGARGRAKALLDRARKLGPDDLTVTLAAEQLTTERLDGDSRPEWLTRGDLREGRWGEASARLQATAQDARAGAGRLRALHSLADLARAGGRFADAAQALERALALRPEADDALMLRFVGALARWAAGEDDAPRAVAELEALRERAERAVRAHGAGPVDEAIACAHVVHERCEHVLSALDRAAARTTTQKTEREALASETGRRSASERLRAAASASGRRPAVKASSPSAVSSSPSSVAARRAARPSWIPAVPRARPCRLGERDPGAAIVRYLLDAHELPAAARQQELPTMAHVRQALDKRGLVTRRVVVDEALLEAALAAGVHVVLEEELSVGTGFVLIAGYEPVAGLVLVVSPSSRPGPYLTTLATQWGRCELSGKSGLLVTGTGADATALAARLGPRGQRTDRMLAAIDACHIDETGRVPPRARRNELAQQAFERARGVPMVWLRLGEAILARMAAGELDPVEDAVGLVRLYCDARDEFPDAEWPLTLHARLLELQGRREESGIAWSDAAAVDATDERNHLGMARAAAYLGDLGAARGQARRALALAPGDASGHALLAEVTLADQKRQGALEEAALFAELAVDLAPKEARALRALASVEERRGRFKEAEQLLVAVEEADARDLGVRLRLLRRCLHAGDWDRAAERAQGLCEVAPEFTDAWQNAAEVAWLRCEGQATVDLALNGIQRCGPAPALLSLAVRGAACFFSREQVMGVVEAALGLSAGVRRALSDVSSSLAAAGLDAEAEGVARHALEVSGDGREQAWHLARLLLRRPRGRKKHLAEVTRLLEGVVGDVGGAPLPRLVLGLLVVGRDPARALKLVEEAEADAFPGLAWLLTAKAFEGTRRADQARRSRERLPELYPTGVLEPASFLRGFGLHDEALELLEPAVAAFPRDVPCRVERALALRALGRPREALDALLAAEGLDAERTPRWALLELAHALEDWPTLARVAGAHIEEGLRLSLDGAYYDVWPARARLAGARLALGDARPRAELLRRVGQHPLALAALCDIERRLGSRGAEELEGLLEEVAPGALGLVSLELR